MRDPKAAAERLLINRNFALLWFGQLLSGLGDQVFETTLVVWIAAELAPDKSWKSLAVSGLLVAAAIPVLVIGPVAGVFVDRWRDKRAVMMRADLLSALLILALLPATDVVRLPGVAGALPLAWRLGAIFLVVLVARAVAQFFRPASSVLLRDVVPEPELPRATGLNQGSSSFAVLIGPPLAAPLLFAFSAEWALLIDAASFLISMLMVRAMTVPVPADVSLAATTEANFVSEFREGWRFFRDSRVLFVVAVSLVIVTFGPGALNTLDVFFVQQNLGAPVKYFGFLGAALGSGMLAGSALATAIAARLRLEQMLWGSLALVGLVVLVYARMTSLAPAIAVIFFLGLVIPIANVSIGPLVLRVTPRDMVGRVMATIGPLQFASLILGMLLGGILYGTSFRDFEGHLIGMKIGPLDTIFTCVGVLCLIGAAFARANLDNGRAGNEPSRANGAQ